MKRPIKCWDEVLLKEAEKAGVPEEFLTEELLDVCDIATYPDTDRKEFLKALVELLTNPKTEVSCPKD